VKELDILNLYSMDKESSLWYLRLDHISERGVNCLYKKYVLSRLKNAEWKKCEKIFSLHG